MIYFLLGVGFGLLSKYLFDRYNSYVFIKKANVKAAEYFNLVTDIQVAKNKLETYASDDILSMKLKFQEIVGQMNRWIK